MAVVLMQRSMSAMKALALAAAVLAATVALPLPALAQSTATPAVASAPARGVVRQVSSYGFDETIRRIRADLGTKNIPVFAEIDQQRLGAGANLPIRRSTLILFGNPPLGVQFLQANPLAGLDWPVRMLVTEDAGGLVWLAWTDFAFIADRYTLTGLAPQLAMATRVAASVAAATR
jgi:uncharacterized protein (DUF302 family)